MKKWLFTLRDPLLIVIETNIEFHINNQKQLSLWHRLESPTKPQLYTLDCCVTLYSILIQFKRVVERMYLAEKS